MARYSDDEWRKLLELAHEAADLASTERILYLEKLSLDKATIDQVLDLIREFEETASAPALVDEGDGSIPGHIGRFEVSGMLGQGGMGRVYAAYDPDLRRKVAIKVLLPVHGLDAKTAANRAIREARLASALNHPNIATVYEVIRLDDGAVAIVMELLGGRHLRSLISGETALSAGEMASLARQIADALIPAHAAGIVHGDIKPENVMLSEQGVAKVLDFGLARDTKQNLLSTASTRGVAAGTWRYMAPEQCRGQAAGSAADMFALGLILYEMYAGVHPFLEDSAIETMHRILTETPRPPAKWRVQPPVEIEKLIFRLVEKEQEKRPSAEEASRILGVKTAEPVPARGFLQSATWQAVLVASIVIAVVFLRWPGGIKQELVFEQLTNLVAENRCTSAAVSSDGKTLAYATADGVFLQDTTTREVRMVQRPKDFWVEKLSWFPDGEKFLASGYASHTNIPSVWTIFANGDAPRLLRENARAAVVAPDGLRVAFVSGDAGSIWVMGSAGNDAQQLVTASGNDSFPFVLWSGNGSRLGFQRRKFRTQGDLGFVMMDRFYSRSYETVEALNGTPLSKQEDVWMESASEALDGRLLYLKYREMGSKDAHEVLEVPTDPKTGGFAGQARMVALSRDTISDLSVFGLSASQDHKTIAVLNRSSDMAVFLAQFHRQGASLSDIRRLTLNNSVNFADAWTANSEGLVLESDMNGRWDLFFQAAHARIQQPLFVDAQLHKALAQLAPDEESVLFLSFPVKAAPGTTRLRRLLQYPLKGGEPKEVPLQNDLDEFRCSTAQPRRCVLRETEDRKWFHYFALDPVRGKGQQLARTAWQEPVVGDWSISPDGKTLAIPNHDTRSATIRLVSLDGGGESRMELRNYSDLTGVVWAADGSGWFVSLETSIGGRTVFVDSKGDIQALGNFSGLALPSPNGKQIAFRDKRSPSNAWLMRLDK